MNGTLKIDVNSPPPTPKATPDSAAKKETTPPPTPRPKEPTPDKKGPETDKATSFKFLNADGTLVENFSKVFEGKKRNQISSLVTEAVKQITESKISYVKKVNAIQGIINEAYDATGDAYDDPNAGIISEEAKKLREANMANALLEIKKRFEDATQAIKKGDIKNTLSNDKNSKTFSNTIFDISKIQKENYD
jgi:hypothetical protein